MAKNSIRDYSATNSSNTEIQSIDISEGCSPAGINNAIREVMADLKDVSTGAVALESPAFDSASLTGDLTFGDSDKAIFGNSSDLQIYHDGSASYIDDTGTGNLKIRAANFEVQDSTGTNTIISAVASDGEARLNYGGSMKLNTSSTGIDITGTVTADNVGIGATTVDSLLHLQKSDVTAYSATATDGQVGVGPTIYLENPANSNTTVGGQIVFGMRSTESQARIGATGGASPALVFGTNDAERLHIDSAGIISKDGTFSYSGTSDNFYWNVGSGDRFRFHSGVTASRDILGFSNPNGGVGAINTNGTTTSFVTSSDYRLKTAVEYDWNATTRLKQLKPARFKWIADGDDAVEVDGFLAHEVESIIPEAITGNGKDAMMDEAYEVSAEEKDADGNVTKEAVMGTRSVPDYQGIDQSKLVPLLVKTIQELEARITALEAN